MKVASCLSPSEGAMVRNTSVEVVIHFLDFLLLPWFSSYIGLELPLMPMKHCDKSKKIVFLVLLVAYKEPLIISNLMLSSSMEDSAYA